MTTPKVTETTNLRTGRKVNSHSVVATIAKQRADRIAATIAAQDAHEREVYSVDPTGGSASRY